MVSRYLFRMILSLRVPDELTCFYPWRRGLLAAHAAVLYPANKSRRNPAICQTPDIGLHNPHFSQVELKSEFIRGAASDTFRIQKIFSCKMHSHKI